MPIEKVKRNIELLKQSIAYMKQKGLQPKKGDSGNFANFNKQQESYYQKNYFSALQALSKVIPELDKYNEYHIMLEKQLQKLSYENPDQNLNVIVNMLDILEQMPFEDHKGSSKNKAKSSSMVFELPKNVSQEIKEELEADLKELQRCYQNNCLRSAVILCGRMLETALHRKYFELTKVDILETNPGIGLGTLIAKLTEKGMHFDPGVTQQIHLINQVRIFSVHKKQEPFYPSSNQAQAMVLFTMDTLQKLFQ